ncbi:MAG: DAK2 domain-containing protein [Oscillospiraceae bacterium]|nr:DAK2 domain-containing protein [Oscillospiraceae bacterium]
MMHTIDGTQFKQMILHGAAAITLQKQQINDLNVFPVPDGDTGTNMSLTIGAASAELKKSGDSAIGQAAAITAGALLRGARGNSGVILSLLFRGLSKTLKGHDTADGALLAAAMQEGVASAYGAVMKPAEGTVLTVSRLAAKRAVEAAAEQNEVDYVLSEALRVGYEVLAQTTDMNPVLKKAGVVDAGGKGYLVILEGMLASLRGEDIPEVDEDASSKREKADFNSFSAEEITFAFDTVFIVRKSSEHVDLNPLRAYLGGIGDSLVIGEDDEAFKVHVHTNTPGSALNEAQKYGTLELAKIENMRTQQEDLAAGKKAQCVDDLEEDEPPVPAEPEKKYGFLAVCAGDGLAAVFQDLGADGIISGGQTMNPSTESILKEIERVPAQVVFVLPNNKNIIMAAQQCVGLTDKEVVVVPTVTVPQGITAMMAVDPELEQEELLETMTESIKNVSTAQITYAARNSDFDGFAISEGDYLALLDGKLFGTDRDIAVLLEKLAQEAGSRGAEFVTLFSGEDVQEEQAEKAQEIFASHCPDAELSVLPGGQPVYYYIISME